MSSACVGVDVIATEFLFIIYMMACVAACGRDVNALPLTILRPFPGAVITRSAKASTLWAI